MQSPQSIASCPPLFGVRRPLACPIPQRYELTADDGEILQAHRVNGGPRGPVILAAGTAMSALCYLTDTTEPSFAEYLASEGFDVWLFDWRTSPYLAAHERGYGFDDVAKYDWPVVIRQVRELTGAHQISVLAHCLSAPCLLLSLLRGYVDARDVRALVASQAGLHLVMNPWNRFKIQLRVDKLLPGARMVHQSERHRTSGIWDAAVHVLAKLWPKSYCCSSEACHRQSATYGDIVSHDQISEQTHGLMGALVPAVNSSFLKDAANKARAYDVLDAADRGHMERLDLPLLLISGRENQMFLPESTRRTQCLLEGAGLQNVRREVFAGFGHLDCYLSAHARVPIWERLAAFLDPRAPS